MARIGQGINAALGAVNYAPYMQGAAMGAQALGQGMGTLGKGIGEALKQYGVQEEQKQTTLVPGIVKTLADNPELIKQLSEEDRKEIERFEKTKDISFRKAQRLYGSITSLQESMDTKAIRLGAQAIQSGVTGWAEKLREGGVLPSAKALGTLMQIENMAAQTANARAEAALRAAQAKPKTQVYGPPITPEQIQKFAEGGVDVNAEVGPEGGLFIKSMSGFNRSPLVNLAPGENKYSQRANEIAAQQDADTIDLAQKTVQSAARDVEALRILKEGKPITGFGADLRKDFVRMVDLFKKSKRSAEEISDSEMLGALLGQDTFSQIQQSGVGARGMDTPAERDFMRDVLSGRIELNDATLSRLIQLRLNQKSLLVDSVNERIGAGELDRWFTETKRRKRTFEFPKLPSTAAPPVQQPALRPLSPRTQEYLNAPPTPQG
jgi:hypothetical protein